MKKILSGNHAAAVAAQLARTQVSVGYPITPATQVFEVLAEMKSKGEFLGEFIAAESEHSVMAALLGASTAGARTFTATSSHGLAYMHEVLHWVAGARLPVVMIDVNRALAAAGIYASGLETGSDLESLFLELTGGEPSSGGEGAFLPVTGAGVDPDALRTGDAR